MVRPLHVLLLLALVLGLIGFSTKVLAGGGTEEAPAAAKPAIAESAAAATPVAPADDGTDQGQNLPLAQPVRVEGRPAPTYMAGAKAPANQPGLRAAAYASLDVGTNQIILAQNDVDQRPFASLTKVMTGLLVAEAGNLAHPVVVSEVAAGVEPNKDGLIIGNTYPRGVLLYSAMLGSNNDAAAALGEDLGGTYGTFYNMMNKRGRELGLTGTQYASSSGLNDGTNWSTARDQAIVLASAMQQPVLAKAMRTSRHTVRWPDDGSRRTYDNNNKMLNTYPGTISGKTGFTTIAGGCLAVAVRRGDTTIVGVVLGTNDIWGDMQMLMDASFARVA